MKIVRRVHMYLGLLLFPWILMFGISGMLFNHPEIGRDIDRRYLSGEQVSALTGFQPWDPDALARRVVAQLNAGSPAPYTLDEDTSGSFSGWPLLAAPRGDGGRQVVILRLDDGSATVSSHAPEPEAPAPPFAGAAIDLPDHRMAAVQEQMKELLPRMGVEAQGPLRAHPKVAPELRFRMRDAEDRAWNVTYNLGTGRLDGRLDGGPGRPRLVEVLETLHKTHHFPVHGGMTWVWALFADITGLTLAVWALSGLVMWWQMKPTRVIGAAAVAAALALSAVVMSGTASDVLFGNVDKDGP
ncbi:PepSY domain-containing protein [Sorangium sp. So ce406]|uniref:PepSY domain-containing protein n=1 Tax=Sorangium sp. So ce406 TaxID=3133311 RepID=UPI003F5BA833